MKIAIDARLYGFKHAGIGRYVENLISQLARLDEKNHYVIITHPKTELKKLPKNAKVIRSNTRHYTLKEQTSFLSVLNNCNADVYHIPHFNVPVLFNKPFIVTIHDLLWHEKIGLQSTTLSPLTYVLKYAGYRLTVKAAVHKASHIVVPTNSVKQTLIQTLHVPNEKISVTYEAPDELFSRPVSKQPLPKQFNLPSPYIIYTGSLYPHKNVSILLTVLNALPDLHLAIASARTVFWEKFKAEVDQAGLRERVHLLGFVPDSQLQQLYTKATALILPSQSEGFGLTGLEAMATGLPVIATDTPILSEVYGSAAILVNTANADEICEAIKKLHANNKLRSRLIELGKIQAKQYSWQTMAAQTLSLYHKVAGNEA